MSTQNTSVVDALIGAAMVIGGFAASLIGWAIGNKLFPPSSHEETEKRIASALFSSFTVGVALFVYILSYQHGAVEMLISACSAIGIKPILVYGYIAAMCMAVAGLFGWWIFLIAAAIVIKRAEKFKQQIERHLDELTGDNDK